MIYENVHLCNVTTKFQECDLRSETNPAVEAATAATAAKPKEPANSVEAVRNDVGQEKSTNVDSKLNTDLHVQPQGDGSIPEADTQEDIRVEADQQVVHQDEGEPTPLEVATSIVDNVIESVVASVDDQGGIVYFLYKIHSSFYQLQHVNKIYFILLLRCVASIGNRSNRPN